MISYHRFVVHPNDYGLPNHRIVIWTSLIFILSVGDLGEDECMPPVHACSSCSPLEGGKVHQALSSCVTNP